MSGLLCCIISSVVVWVRWVFSSLLSLWLVLWLVSLVIVLLMFRVMVVSLVSSCVCSELSCSCFMFVVFGNLCCGLF